MITGVKIQNGVFKCCNRLNIPIFIFIIMVNRVGLKYGFLTVIKYSHLSHHHMWVCECVCGKLVTVGSGNLITEHTKSCGCMKKSLISTKRTTHGQTRSNEGNWTPEYRAWTCMITRCTNPNCNEFENYGGRGITVCERWINSFQAFFEDMGTKPSNSHSLDRFPNMNGNYEPSNCRWATKKQQQGNKRNNRIIEYNGQSMPMCDWASLLKVTHGAIINHLNKGRSFHRIFMHYKYKNDNNIKRMPFLSSD